jgi:RimJ/RimL family protein N-acetyltransferase
MLRDASESDVDTIRRWRNHPKVRGASIMVDYITPEGHREWWDRVSADPSRCVLIFEYEGVPCGVVTINDHDPVAGTAEWGFFLDVDGLEARGQLLPAWMELEKAAVAYGFDEMKLKAMGGRTLAWNKQVIALHRRFGFVEVPERRYVTQIAGQDQEVVWTELTADKRRAR